MRLLTALLALLLIVLLTFSMIFALPGDPFNDENGLPKATREALIDHYGLGDPLYVQLGRYLASIARFDLGPSLVHKGTSVQSIIAKSFPVSLLLGGQALALAIVGGTLLGTSMALKGSKKCALISLLFISMPSFVLATLLLYLFGFHGVLPILALAAAPTAFIAKQLAHNFREIYAQEYILAAYAKGLTPFTIFYSYVFKNGTLPLLGYLGQLATQVLTGSFMVEKIFAIPGLGYWMVTSVLNRDYPMIMGLTLLFSCMLFLLTTLADLFQRRAAVCA